MMLRLQNERMNGALLPTPQEYYKIWGLTAEKLALAKPDAIVMHPGPMNRGVEIDSAVADGNAGGDPAPGHLRHRRAHGGDEHAGQPLSRGQHRHNHNEHPHQNGRVIDPANRTRRGAGHLHRRRQDRRARAAPPTASKPSARSTPAGSSSRPASSTSPPACANPASNTAPRSNPKWTRRWPAASPAWPFRPTPTRRWTSPAWSRCSPTAPRSSTAPTSIPVGALTIGLKGERLSEMAELVEAGCVAFSQANVPILDNTVLMRALQYAATFGFRVWLQPLDPFLARGGVRPRRRGGLPPRPAGIPVAAETSPCTPTSNWPHHRRPPAHHPPVVRRRPRADRPGARRWHGRHLRRVDQPCAPVRHGHRLLQPQLPPDPAAAQPARPRGAEPKPGRGPHQRHVLGPHPGGRRRQAGPVLRIRARRHRPRAAAAADAEVGGAPGCR
jgi:hypothetical protein